MDVTTIGSFWQFVTPRLQALNLLSCQDASQAKSEIRISKSKTNRNTQIRNLKGEIGNAYRNFLLFYHSDLFRISDFEFRICNFVCLGVLRAFARLTPTRVR